jgi:hypothetical protein
LGYTRNLGAHHWTCFTMKLDKILHNIGTKEEERNLGRQKVPMKILQSTGCAFFLNFKHSSF